MGGGAVISAAMPLQPSPPFWHPALFHPWSRSPRLPSTSVSSPPEPGVVFASSPICLGRALQVKEKKKKYMYYYINLKKKKKEKEKKDYRELEIKVEVLLWNAEVMHYMEFQRWRCTGNLLILYILNLKIWKSDRQIKDKINLLWCGRSDVVLWRRRSNSQPLGFHCLTCSCGFRKTCHRYSVVTDNNTTVGQVASSRRQHFV